MYRQQASIHHRGLLPTNMKSMRQAGQAFTTRFGQMPGGIATRCCPEPETRVRAADSHRALVSALGPG